MYYLKKTLEIAIAHKLDLPYESKCKKLHGHNLKITVYCKSETLNADGMIIDFTEIKRIVNKFDHEYLNSSPLLLACTNPTAENLAFYLCTHIKHCYKVDIQESKGNVASYEKD
jgi:6-pyruvoyltetrahydropterin/6-carboxytetrahydropterin synthase